MGFDRVISMVPFEGNTLSSSHPSVASDFTILLTATVSPNPNLTDLTRTNPKSREDDYIRSLLYYLKNHPSIKRYVFAENSGWDLSAIQAAIAPAVTDQVIEFHSVAGNDYPGEYSIGYGESVLIERAFASSSLLRSSRFWVKATGRLRILNLTSLLNSVKPHDQFYGDWKNYQTPVGLDKSRRGFSALRVGWFHCEMLDTRFLVMTPHFYMSYLRELHHAHRQGRYWLEGQWLNVIKSVQGQNGVTTRLRREPRWAGISGTFGWNYGGPFDRIKTTVRAFSRLIFPMYHI